MARLDWSRLHSKILRSSIWAEDPLVRLVWICALADSETNGRFYGSTATLSRAWNLEEKIIVRGLKRLMEPDPHSATKDHEGRRIINEGENEWRVLNKRLYNPSGEPSGASTVRVQKHRALLEASETQATEETGNDSNGRNALEEIRLDQSEKREEKTPPTPRKRGESENGFSEFWTQYPKKVGKGKAREVWDKMTPTERSEALEKVPGFRDAWAGAPEENLEFLVHPKTWLGQKRWTDDPVEWTRAAWKGVSRVPIAPLLVGSHGPTDWRPPTGTSEIRRSVINAERELPAEHRRVTGAWTAEQWKTWNETGEEILVNELAKE